MRASSWTPRRNGVRRPSGGFGPGRGRTARPGLRRGSGRPAPPALGGRAKLDSSISPSSRVGRRPNWSASGGAWARIRRDRSRQLRTRAEQTGRGLRRSTICRPCRRNRLSARTGSGPAATALSKVGSISSKAARAAGDRSERARPERQSPMRRNTSSTSAKPIAASSARRMSGSFDSLSSRSETSPSNCCPTASTWGASAASMATPSLYPLSCATASSASGSAGSRCSCRSSIIWMRCSAGLNARYASPILRAISGWTSAAASGQGAQRIEGRRAAATPAGGRRGGQLLYCGEDSASPNAHTARFCNLVASRGPRTASGCAAYTIKQMHGIPRYTEMRHHSERAAVLRRRLARPDIATHGTQMERHTPRQHRLHDAPLSLPKADGDWGHLRATPGQAWGLGPRLILTPCSHSGEVSQAR